MTKYDFDHCADRRISDATKYRKLKLLYGREDLNPFWIADMDFEVVPEITEALTQRISHPVYGYATVPDDFFKSITDWLESRHNFHVESGEISFVAGIVRALGYLVNRLTEPGDKVMIQPPVYHPFRNIVANNGRIVVENPLRQTPDGFYAMDLADFEAKIKAEKPKMLILCNPHNPIGIQWDEDTLRQVAHICNSNGVIVISDEIHADLMLPGCRHIPYMSVSDEACRGSIMLGAPSKTFNIAGIESSWMVIKDESLRRNVFEWMETNEFSSPTFIATTSTIAAYRNGAEWLDQALEYIQENIDWLSENLPAMTDGKIKVIKPQASFLVWLDCKALKMNTDELNDFFVNKARLALNPGAMFGNEGAGYMRMNVGCPRYMIEEAVKNLAIAVKNLEPVG